MTFCGKKHWEGKKYWERNKVSLTEENHDMISYCSNLEKSCICQREIKEKGIPRLDQDDSNKRMAGSSAPPAIIEQTWVPWCIAWSNNILSQKLKLPHYLTEGSKFLVHSAALTFLYLFVAIHQCFWLIYWSKASATPYRYLFSVVSLPKY